MSKCSNCILGTRTYLSTRTERENLSMDAIFLDADLENPFAEGKFRLVALGKYRGGLRAGHLCVRKWFKDSTLGDEYYEEDIAAADKAIELVDSWNKSSIIGEMIKVNKPEVKVVGNRKYLQGSDVFFGFDILHVLFKKSPSLKTIRSLTATADGLMCLQIGDRRCKLYHTLRTIFPKENICFVMYKEESTISLQC